MFFVPWCVTWESATARVSRGRVQPTWIFRHGTALVSMTNSAPGADAPEGKDLPARPCFPPRASTCALGARGNGEPWTANSAATRPGSVTSAAG